MHTCLTIGDQISPMEGLSSVKMNAAYGPRVLMTPSHGPSSPPITPDSGNRGLHTARPTGKASRRMGLYLNASELSPPTNEDGSTAEGMPTTLRSFLSIPRSESQQSRASSQRSGSPGFRRHRGTPDIDVFSEASDKQSLHRRSASEDDDELVVEELAESDPLRRGRQHILRPYAIEDAESVRTASPLTREQLDMVKTFSELQHGENRREAAMHDFENWKRRRKRRSVRSKRTLSISRGSDPDDEDVQQLEFDEAGSSARRVRRRFSLTFEDPPLEDKTEAGRTDDEIQLIDAPPLYEAVDWSLHLQSMPYYNIRDPMTLDDDDDAGTNTTASSSIHDDINEK